MGPELFCNFVMLEHAAHDDPVLLIRPQKKRNPDPL